MAFIWLSTARFSHLYLDGDGWSLCNRVNREDTQAFNASLPLCHNCSRLQAQYVFPKFTLKESFSPAEKQA